ncbi:MAG: hypothetical protein H6727_01970 [Myxococcales bacterium]|nr:hypothetical protein [Myxococcales bacterium]
MHTTIPKPRPRVAPLFLFCCAFALFLQACPPGFRYYVPMDRQDRKSQQIDLNVGRVFSFRRAVCVAVRVTNWSKKVVEVPRSVMVLKTGDEKLLPMTLAQAGQTAAFARSVRDYYGKSGGRSPEEMAKELYAPEIMKLSPKVAQARMICYAIADRQEPTTFSIEGLEVRGQRAEMKPFQFKELKRP